MRGRILLSRSVMVLTKLLVC